MFVMRIFGVLEVPGCVADHHLSFPKMVCNEVNIDTIGSSHPIPAGLPVKCQTLHHYTQHHSQTLQLANVDKQLELLRARQICSCFALHQKNVYPYQQICTHRLVLLEQVLHHGCILCGQDVY